MGSAYPLTGRAILVVEDEPLLSLEMTALFQSAGATVLSAMNLPAAIGLVSTPGLSAAILDYGLGADKVQALCALLGSVAFPSCSTLATATYSNAFPRHLSC